MLRKLAVETIAKPLLPFGGSTAQMLLNVAKTPVFADPDHGQDLPPSWRTLYELTRMPDLDESPRRKTKESRWIIATGGGFQSIG